MQVPRPFKITSIEDKVPANGHEEGKTFLPAVATHSEDDMETVPLDDVSSSCVGQPSSSNNVLIQEEVECDGSNR